MNRQQRRGAAQERFYPRSDRLFQDSYGWWVRLREGDRGPFALKHIAEVYLVEFLATVPVSAVSSPRTA